MYPRPAIGVAIDNSFIRCKDDSRLGGPRRSSCVACERAAASPEHAQMSAGRSVTATGRCQQRRRGVLRCPQSRYPLPPPRVGAAAECPRPLSTPALRLRGRRAVVVAPRVPPPAREISANCFRIWSATEFIIGAEAAPCRHRYSLCRRAGSVRSDVSIAPRDPSSAGVRCCRSLAQTQRAGAGSMSRTSTSPRNDIVADRSHRTVPL